MGSELARPPARHPPPAARRLCVISTQGHCVSPKSRISGEVFAEGSAPWSKPSLEIPKVGFLGRCLPKAAPPGRNRAWIWAPRGPRGPKGPHGAPWTTILDPKITILDSKIGNIPILMNFLKMDTPIEGGFGPQGAQGAPWGPKGPQGAQGAPWGPRGPRGPVVTVQSFFRCQY